jgi:S-adenosylmethionine-dependent methyltransferase
MAAINKVKAYYNKHVAQEDNRLSENVFELPVTFRYLDRYLRPGDLVLDAACGTGRYAQRLLEKGCLLGLNDLSDKNMELALKRTGNHPNLIHSSVADVLSSDIWTREAWDAILLLGPMYHLPDRNERLELPRKVSVTLKKGGIVFLAFMSRSAALLYGLKNNPAGIQKANGTLKLWATGTDEAFVEGTEWFTHAYFSHPEEIDPLVVEAGLKPLHLDGVEGIFGGNMELYHKLDTGMQQQWMKFNLDHVEDAHLIQHAKHLLSVCQNPVRS